MSLLRRATASLLSTAIFRCYGQDRASWPEVSDDLEIPPKPEFGDFAYPCSKLAKVLRRPPAEIAANLAEWLLGDEQKRVELSTQKRKNRAMPLIQKAEVVGAYLNITLKLPTAAEVVLTREDLYERLDGGPLRFMVEFSQPNTHKAFHVGHMRNLCLGDSLVRLLRALGHTVVATNYFGDMGLHVAKCLWGLRRSGQTLPEENQGEGLGEVYTQAHQQLEAWKDAGAPEYETEMKEVDRLHRALEWESDPDIDELWYKTREASLEAFAEIYAWSDVRFDQVYYESEMSKPSQKLVDTYLAKGIFTVSQGAVGIVNDEFTHMPFFLLRKSNGEGLYATKDLALAIQKDLDFYMDRSIYVVDVRQTDHFRHVFSTLKKMGYNGALLEHVPYEMVELPDGPMSARKGNIVLFRSLREQMVAQIRKEHLDFHQGDWSEAEIALCAHQLALGAIRYGMLNAGPTQKIIFDMTAWMQLRGNTGPYLQYTATRFASILRKCEEEGKLESGKFDPQTTHALVDPHERALVMRLDQYPFVVRNAAQALRPNLLCTYLHHLGQDANRFFQSCGVKSSEGDLFSARVQLVMETLRVLTDGLHLLGIPVPSRM